MAKVIAIANQKGGVGKSTTALALAAGLQQRNYRVLMIDTDPQKNTTAVYKAKTEMVATLYDIFVPDDRTGEYSKASECVQHAEYGDIIPSDSLLQNADTKVAIGPKMYRLMRNALEDVLDSYNYIIIDTPPRAGIILGNVLECADKLIIPVTCDLFGVQGILDFYKTVTEYQEDNRDLSVMGILVVKYKGRQNLTKDVEDQVLPMLAKKMNTRVFGTKIRESVKCQEAQTQYRSLFDYAPSCTTALDYQNLIDEILKEN